MEELNNLKTDLQDLIIKIRTCAGIDSIQEKTLIQVIELIDSKIESITLTNIDTKNNQNKKGSGE